MSTTFDSPKEGLEDQLDRLNLAILNVFDNFTHVRCETSDNRLSPPQSMLTDCFTDECVSISESQMCTDYMMENKLEDLLTTLDRKQMIIEDFLSSCQVEHSLSYLDISRLFSQINRLLNTGSCLLSVGDVKFKVKLNTSPIVFLDKEPISLLLRQSNSATERELALSECILKLQSQLNSLKEESFLAKAFQNMPEDMEHAFLSMNQEYTNDSTENENSHYKDTQIRKQIAQKRKNPEEDWVLHECIMLKENLQKRLKETDLIKERLLIKEKEITIQEISLKKQQEEIKHKLNQMENLKKIHYSDIESLSAQLEDLLRNNGPNIKISSISTEDFVPLVSCNQSIEDLQSRLKTLEQSIPSDEKTSMEIDSVKNQISTLRGEKAIYQSLKTSKDIQSKFSVIEKEETVGSRRQELLRGLSTRCKIDHLSKFKTKAPSKNLEHSKTLPILDNSVVSKEQKIINQYEETRILLEGKRKALNEKEDRLQKNRDSLLSRWSKVPSANDLVCNLKVALNELDKERRHLDNEKEKFLSEVADFSQKKACFYNKYRKFLDDSQQQKIKIKEEKRSIESMKNNLKVLLPNLKELMKTS